MRFFISIIILPFLLSSCVVAGAINVVGEVVETGVEVTGATVATGAKVTGAVIGGTVDAIIPGDQSGKDKSDKEDKK
jgi:hypothetical protein